MRYLDIRSNNYHRIDHDDIDLPGNWSCFASIPYMPLITEIEDWFFDNFNLYELLEFMRNKWYYSVYISIGYVLLIPILQQWMKFRGKPYNLKTVLIIWNCFMALFSILGVIRCVPELYHK